MYRLTAAFGRDPKTFHLRSDQHKLEKPRLPFKGWALRSDAQFSESVDMSIEKFTAVLEDWKRNSDPLALHPDRLLRAKEVCLLTSLPSTQAVHHAINNLSGFPPGGKMGKIRVWKLSEMTEYIARLPTGGPH